MAMLSKHLFAGALCVAFLGAGSELFASYQKGNSLSQDYLAAASCDQKKERNVECTEQESVSVLKRDSNEEFRSYGRKAVYVSMVMGVISIF